jgi:uncharacterized RDD family membrane protein YckC
MEQLPDNLYKQKPALIPDADDFPVNIGIRFVNYLIDVVVIVLLCGVIGVCIGFGLLWTNKGYLADGPALDILSRLVAIVVAFFYYTSFETLFQRSIGKMITGTLVVDLEGNKPSFGAIAKRSGSRLVPFEVFSFLGSHAGWHDKWSDTRVMKVKDLPNLQIKKQINEIII